MPSSRLTRRSFLARSAATFAAAQFARAHALPVPNAPAVAPRPSPLGAVHLDPESDLAHRTAQNTTRLSDPIYQPPAVFRQTNWQSWPGDFEGRALLAHTLLARATGEVPPTLLAAPAAYRAQLNPQGYFGPLLDPHAINEQQLSGHGWYLRALCEVHDAPFFPQTERDQALAQIRRIVQNLALPLRGAYAQYPIDPALRAQAAAPANPGAVDGHLAARHGNWAVSSDTGCAFIFLDGLTHAWVTLREAPSPAPDPAAAPLKSLIDEAIARFAQTDLVALKAQTHASLTGLRAIMRVYETTSDTNLLHLIEDRYKLYRSTAMTEHYANTNWFGRPDSWTEPCAIIDSYILATQLWQHTGKPAYLEDAHRIWFNGIGRGLRANGGFGTDTCPGATPFVHVRSYEAYFCCTMRGGEAHARAAQYLYFTRPATPATPATITVPFFSDSLAHLALLADQRLLLVQKTQYPTDGTVVFSFIRPAPPKGNPGPHPEAPISPPAPITLRLVAPSWTSAHRLTLNHHPIPHTLQNGFLTVRLTPQPGDILTLNQTLRVAPRDPISPDTPAGSYAFEAGPLLLGYDPAPDTNATLKSPNPTPIAIPRNATLQPTGNPGAYRVAGANITLAPINDLNTTPDPNPRLPHPRQLLFRES
jgi:hypothetical protein